jgi:hypothetical protein
VWIECSAYFVNDESKRTICYKGCYKGLFFPLVMDDEMK